MKKIVMLVATLAAAAAAQLFHEDLGQKVDAKVYFTDADGDGVLSGLETGAIKVHISNKASQDIYKVTFKIYVSEYDNASLVPLAKCGLPRILKVPSLQQVRTGTDTTVEIPLQATGFCMADAKINYEVVLTFASSPGIWSSSYTLNKYCEIPVAFKNKPPLKPNEQGYRKWVIDTKNAGFGGIAVGSNGVIYWHGNAVNPDGTLKWKSPGLTSIAIGSDGTLYCADCFQETKLYALNPDGAVKWALNYAETFAHQYQGTVLEVTDPAIGPDGTIYVCAQADVRNPNLFLQDFIVACTPEGKEKWYLRTPAPIEKEGYASLMGERVLGLAIGKDGTIYGSRLGGTLFAVTPAGTLKWFYSRRNMVESEMSTVPVIASDGTVYVGGFDTDRLDGGGFGAAVYAVNPQGGLKWRYWVNAHSPTDLAIGPDGTVYCGIYGRDTGGKTGLLALNPDGTQKWICGGVGEILSAPAIDADGRIYFLNKFGFQVVGPDGEAVWSRSFKSFSDYSTTQLEQVERFKFIDEYAMGCPAITADGTLYFGQGRWLYAYTSGSPGPADGQWPKSGHDNSNTGRVGGK